MGFLKNLAHGWNAFTNQSDDYRMRPFDIGASYGVRPDRTRSYMSNERSIVSAIYARMAIDVASVDIRHIRYDKEGRYAEDILSPLHDCLNVEANIDQTGRHLIQDAVMSMLNEGTIAIVPVDTSISPEVTGGYDIETLRVGRITQWFPRHVRVELYNDQTGRREEVTLQKKAVAIVENPLYAVMNEPNSTLQRLIRKLNMLDAVDEQSASGKLDLIIQLPYTIRSEAMRTKANQRKRDIEVQLKDSQYGIAYADAAEKITQLNRPAENNLLNQVEYLTEMLYGQLGITREVMNGTADEKTMINYINRTIEPILAALTDEMRRKFLTKTARTQKQDLVFFRDPFKLVPLSDLAELADKFTRNEILTGNEFRQVIGMKPASDPKADELFNSNLNRPLDAPALPVGASEDVVEGEIVEDDPYAGILETVNEAIAELGGE